MCVCVWGGGGGGGMTGTVIALHFFCKPAQHLPTKNSNQQGRVV